jgi:hypothetical protein
VGVCPNWLDRALDGSYESCLYTGALGARHKHGLAAESGSRGSSAPPAAARDVAEFVVLLACPLGPIPLAARGLAAVLARAGPAGAVVDEHPGRRRRRGPAPAAAGADPYSRMVARIRDLQDESTVSWQRGLLGFAAGLLISS